MLRVILSAFYSGHFQHPTRSFPNIIVMILVTVIYDLLYSFLNNDFRTFIARKKSTVDTSTFGGSIGVQDSISFGVHDIGIFFVTKITLSFPRQITVSTTSWKTVITKSYYYILIIDNASAILSAWIF